MDCVYHYSSPFGGMTMAGCGDALTGLWFDDQRFFGEGMSGISAEGHLPVFEETVLWLNEYFSGRIPPPPPRALLRGTPYRRAVWDVLTSIPYGQTITYSRAAKEAARRLGTVPCPRAAGAAAGHTPILLIIPCHRLIGAGGRMTGYAAGIDRKIRHLEMEKNVSGSAR